MRLSPQQVHFIRERAEKNFGSEAHIWLFGSRADDHAKGGDIDLYIETEQQDADEIINAKLRFLCDLHVKFGEQKIDVVLRRSGSDVDLPIYRIAKETGVLLQ